jgi:hypothetical protein
MKLFEKVKGFVKSEMIKAQKDNVLVTAIHQIMVDELGWVSRKIEFGTDRHEMEYRKPGSQLKELEIEANRIRSRLYIKFEGEKRGTFNDIMDGIFDVDAGEIRYHLVLDIDKFVDEGLNLINEDELVRIVSDHVHRIEDRAGRV